ncbi:hypothetical protein LLDT2_11735 [Lactococcus lactis subsp. lactis bv. diacetylactis str. TIFN2]|nr:hypothetical protein LLDT2_11735 [Lactococcus lactis subsp. lactis bv. diacetylactis str. TIFN2]
MISKQFFMPGDVMSHVIINFAESFYCYYYTDKKQGKMQLQETLKFLKKNRSRRFSKNLKATV